MKHSIYLVSGAAGNLGSSICRQLVEQGQRVRALALKGDPAAARIPKEVELMFGDVTDKASLERFFTVESGTEVVVIHSASIVTVTPQFSQKVQDVNVTGTLNMVNKCLEHKVKKLVYISSTSAIPELPKGQAIKEVASHSTKGIVGHYGQTKAEASQIVLDAVKAHNLDASIVYPTGIAGPGDYAYGPVANFIMDYVKGGMPAGVEGSFNAVDVRDLARGVIACTEKGRKGEGYIMGNSLVSMKEMFRLVSQASGAKEVKTILPTWFAYAMGRISEVVSKITRKPSALTTFAVYNLARNNTFDCSKAQKELGYTVRPFSQTIADTVGWLKAEGKI